MLKFLKFLVFLLMLTILIKGLFIFASKDFFKVVNVKVEGSNELIKFDITEKILQIKDNANLVYINTKKLEKYLSEDVRIKSVKVTKVYPSELVVKIEGNKPYSYLRQKNNFYVINDKGEIFASINEITDKNLPIINADNKEDLETILQVLSKITNEGFFSNISEVRKVKSDYEILLNDGTLIKTAIVVDAAKYDNCFKLYKSLINENKKVEYIDLRFKDINLKEKDLLQTNLEGKNGRDPK
ncbi:cell division protein FtsQ/DivIB [Sebaldella sp. S0638]|uniref:cell division protein FtsQ/DivIB n=1 Tax=Sebaldella sp. S0638 TaxID=2957809 RepID=UPI00209F3869|nr:cell division protein FtsQ/DivIB [Sebaldella sp. S0638]MCP1223944.1 cell division protein FtsQ/DivIB [Sebaldella sp. S0638]